MLAHKFRTCCPPDAPDFFHVVEHLFDGPAIGEGLDDLLYAGGRIGAVEELRAAGLSPTITTRITPPNVGNSWPGVSAPRT